MLILTRIILGLTALNVAFVVFGVIGSCGGARNCDAALGGGLSWVFIISLPFAVSVLTLDSRNIFASVVYLVGVATVSVFVCILFSFRAVPWNLINAFASVASWKGMSFPMFLVGILPSILVHLSLLCMLIFAPGHIKGLAGSVMAHRLVLVNSKVSKDTSRHK